MAQHRQPQQNEFLPLCDVLFNIISLASYFCDIVFDFAMVYALAHHSVGQPTVFPLSITFITTSLLACQVYDLIRNIIKTKYYVILSRYIYYFICL